MGEGTHFTRVETDELVDVENEDWAGALVELRAGTVGSLEASRVIVGPHVQLRFEIHGTRGALGWELERMNELERLPVRRRRGLHARVARSPASGLRGVPAGAGIPMGYDDLRVLEAANFLAAVRDGEQREPGLDEMVATARVLDAIERSAESGLWRTCAPARPRSDQGRQRPAQLRGVRDDRRDLSSPSRSSERVLAEIRAAGYAGTDLGPPGYLGDVHTLADRLGDLRLSAASCRSRSPPSATSEGCTRRSTCSTRPKLAAHGRSCATPGGPERVANPGAGAALALDAPAGAASSTAWHGPRTSRASAATTGLPPPHVDVRGGSCRRSSGFLEDTDVPLLLDSGHLLVAGGDPLRAPRRLARPDRRRPHQGRAAGRRRRREGRAGRHPDGLAARHVLCAR
jgi:hypothetical protein